MGLVISLGGNYPYSKNLFKEITEILSQRFKLLEMSNIYLSSPADNCKQPFFYNQLLEFQTPTWPLKTTLQYTQEIEKKFQNKKVIYKGPRAIDIDIILQNLEIYQDDQLIVPHQSAHLRNFILLPLLELKNGLKYKEFLERIQLQH